MFLLLVALLAQTAPPPAPLVVNPSILRFDCPDHATDTDHLVEFLNAKGEVVGTLLGGDPPADPFTGEVTIPILMQPIKTGFYTVRLTVMRNGELSTPAATPTWLRGYVAPPVVKK